MKTKKTIAFVIGTVTTLMAVGFLASCGGSKEYTMTFNTNGGSNIEPLKIKWGDTPNMPDNPIKAGYTFVDWYKEESLTNVYTPAPVETDLTVYAKWSINSYTVTFNSLGGSPVNPITDTFGASINEDDVKATREYYTFGGWYTDNEFKNPFNYKIPSSNMTVFAKWTANNIIFTFDKNSDAANGTMDDFQVTENSSSKKLPACEFYLEGYNFMGWAKEPTGEVIYEDQEDLVHIEGNGKTKLYAIWEIKKQTINYYVSYQNQPYKTFENVEYGSDLPKPDPDPELLGFEFKGWGKMVESQDLIFAEDAEYFVSRGTNRGYSLYNNYNVGDKVPTDLILYKVNPQISPLVGEENNFYALFVRKQTTITFYDSYTGDPIAKGQFTGYYGSPLTDFPSDIPTHDGYKIGKLYFDSGCTLEAPEVIKFGADNYNLYYDYNIQSYSLTKYIDENTSITLPNIEYNTLLNEVIGDNPTKTGYTFDYWYYLDGNVEVKVTDSSRMLAENLTIYAKFTIKTITISFVTNSSDVDNFSLEGEYNSLIPAIKTVTKTGYTFTGWFTDFECTKGYNFQTYKNFPADNLTVYAGWSKNSYKIEFKIDGVPTHTASVPYGDSMSSAKPTDPVKTGYSFGGWSINGTDVFDFSQTMGARDIVLTPIWVPVDVNVAVDFVLEKLGVPGQYDSYSSDVYQAKSDSSFSYLNIDNIPTVTGFTLDPNACDEPIKVSSEGTSKYTVRYSRNTYKVTFVDGDGETLFVDSSVQYGYTYTKLNDAIYKDNKHINTYKINDDQDVYEEEEILEAIGEIEADTIIHVIQTEIDGLIKFNPNGGKFQDGSTGVMNVKEIIGTLVNIPTVTRDGYDFDGWYHIVEGKEEKYTDPTIEVKEEGDAFTAHWVAQARTITFSFNDGITDPTVKNTHYDETIDMLQPTRTGYTFAGWYHTVEGKTEKYEYATLKVADNDTFTAHWTAKTTSVTFDANGGTGTMTPNPQVIAASDDTRLLNANTFTREGYNFVGWSLSEQGEVAFTDKDALSIDYIDANSKVTLYAIWEAKDITYTFQLDNGSQDIVKTGKFGTAVDVPTNIEKTGYTFLGWYQVIDGQISDVEYDFTVNANYLSKDAKFIAKWQGNTYTVTFNSNEGDAVTPSSKDVTYNSTYGDLPTPTRTGYDFDGWFTLSEGGSEVTSSTLVEITNGQTLFAHWTVHKHTITYYVNNEQYLDPKEYVYGQAMSAPTAPTSSLSYFVCWLDENGEIYKFTTMGDEDVKVYAYFIPYTIQFVGDSDQIIFTISSDKLPSSITSINQIDEIFQIYIQNLFNEVKGYELVLNAVDLAAGGNQTSLTVVGTFCTVMTKTAGTLDCDTVIYLVKDALTGSGIPEDTISSTVTDLYSYLPYENTKAYIDFITETVATFTDPIVLAEALHTASSAAYNSASNEFMRYENNAYRPYADEPETYFDGWLEGKVREETTTAVITYEPRFVKKANPVNYVSTSSITSASATFTWDAVSGAFAYDVVANIYNSEHQLVNTVTETVATNQITISGLETNYTVEFEIKVVLKDGNNAKRVTTVYTATSLVTGKEIHTSEVSLLSDSKIKLYTHLGSSDMGEDSGSGDYYYETKDGEVYHYIFFTESFYDFHSYDSVEVSDASDEGLFTISDDKVINIGTKQGNFKLKTTKGETTKEHICHIYPKISSVEYGPSLSRRENITLVNDAKSELAKTASYLAQDTVNKKPFTIGAYKNANVGSKYSYTDDNEVTYYNGVKFDFEALDITSLPFTMDADYSFTLGGADISNLVIHDKENDVFYLSDTLVGETITVTIKPKADIEGTYVNRTIPKAYKTEAKLQTLTKSYQFLVNGGINIYDDVCLKKALLNKTTTEINFMNDIKVNTLPEYLIYKDLAKEKLSGYALLDDNGNVINGCVDVIDYTAVMTTDAVKGSKIWIVNNTNPVFWAAPTGPDEDPIGYSYAPDGQGIYAIESAEFKQNWGNGQFVITNCSPNKYGSLSPYGLSPYSPFFRSGTGFSPVTINGNYFTVDASSLPSVYAVGYNGVGSIIGAYRVQNIGNAIFNNCSDARMTLNEMTIIGNTSNLSASIPTESGGSSVAQQMTIASGGINGVYAGRYADTNEAGDIDSPNGHVVINSVNIYDSLIAIYADQGIKSDYVHVRNCWANGCYQWTRFGQNVTTKFEHTLLEASGGCATHIDDSRYDIEYSGQIYNPHGIYDMSTCKIENFITGEEQWFKAYGMEIVAMKLKTTIEAQIRTQSEDKLTIIQEKENPVTGRVNEYINWIFFDKTNDLATWNGSEFVNVSNQTKAYIDHPEDIGAQLSFDKNYKDTVMIPGVGEMKLPTIPGLGQIYAEADADGNIIFDPATGNCNIVVASYLDPNGEIPLYNIPQMNDKGEVVMKPLESCMLGFTTFNLYTYQSAPADAVDQVTLFNNLYLYFRQGPGELEFQVQGMVQVFSTNA